jgi:hypothetical protein
MDNMKKLLLLAFVSFSFGSISSAQDFSFDDLAKLRKNTLTQFESAVHDKGYKLNHLEENSNCMVFRKGSNVISLCEHLTAGGHSHCNYMAVKFETCDRDQYDKLKKQIESNMKYYTTRSRRFRTQHYVDHVYINDDLVVHMYNIAYRDDEKPYYEIEMYSILGDRHHYVD